MLHIHLIGHKERVMRIHSIYAVCLRDHGEIHSLIKNTALDCA